MELIKPMLPNKPRGVPRVDDRRIVNGIFWVLRSGAPWRDLPDRYGPPTTCYNRSDQHMGRSRGGLTIKIHVVVDSNGLPVQLDLTGGQAHDNRLCSVLLRQLPRRAVLLADRGYDADWIRAFVTERGAWANIPPKRNRKNSVCFSTYLYRDRNLVERFFNKIKQCRRVATRYDKLAVNYLAFIKLACIRLWMHVYECTA